MKVTALDENGKPVDWWFIYKVPQLSPGAANDSATGYEYVYYDSTIDKAPNIKDRLVEKSPYTLDKGKGALNNTLNSVFSKAASTTGHILYNDESPAAAKMHDNGILGHSLPSQKRRGIRRRNTGRLTCAFRWTSRPRRRSQIRWPITRNRKLIFARRQICRKIIRSMY